MIIFGAFLVSIFGFGVPTKEKDMVDDEYWRVMFAVQGLFGVIHMIIFALFFNYETPKYLQMTKQEEKLDEVLQRIYHPEDIQLVK